MHDIVGEVTSYCIFKTLSGHIFLTVNRSSQEGG